MKMVKGDVEIMVMKVDIYVYSMNDILYKHLIAPWFAYHERPILQQEDLWLLSHRRAKYSNPYCAFLTDIILHSASPCCPRYCICKYFSMKDKVVYYRRENLM